MSSSRVTRFRPLLACAAVMVFGLTGCGQTPIDRVALRHDAHFWQRAETSAAIYQRGPKAQQMLNRDIARCVTELRELDRLGAIRYVTPAEMYENGTFPDPDSAEGVMGEWDTPERDGYLRAEHLDYHDFETCMMAKGWERVEHLPYDISDESREEYIDAILGEQYQTRTQQRAPITHRPVSDYENIDD